MCSNAFTIFVLTHRSELSSVSYFYTTSDSRHITKTVKLSQRILMVKRVLKRTIWKKTDVHEMREVVREQNALRPWCRMTDAICFDREMLYTLRLLSQLPPKNNSLASGETANSRDEAAMSAPQAPPGGASRRRLLITTTLALKYTAANINCSKSPPTRAKPSRVVSEQTTLTASCYLPNCTVSLLLCLYQSTILIHCQVTERTMFIQVSFVGTTCQKPSIAKYHTIHSSDH